MAARKPDVWMWAQMRAMMNEADEMRGRFFELRKLLGVRTAPAYLDYQGRFFVAAKRAPKRLDHRQRILAHHLAAHVEHEHKNVIPFGDSEFCLGHRFDLAQLDPR